MLEKIKDSENIIMMFFLLMLFLIGSYVIVHVNIVDFIYFLVIIYYFVQFLKLKNIRK